MLFNDTNCNSPIESSSVAAQAPRQVHDDMGPITETPPHCRLRSIYASVQNSSRVGSENEKTSRGLARSYSLRLLRTELSRPTFSTEEAMEVSECEFQYRSECLGCGETMVLPQWSGYLDRHHMQHLWECEGCG
jgi:hypothetical protein